MHKLTRQVVISNSAKIRINGEWHVEMMMMDKTVLIDGFSVFSYEHTHAIQSIEGLHLQASLNIRL